MKSSLLSLWVWVANNIFDEVNEQRIVGFNKNFIDSRNQIL